MHDGGTTGPQLIGARALREWITGERDQYSRVFLLESGATADDVADVAGADDVVLLPEDSGPFRGCATAVRYTGALSEIGDELFFGGRGVELQDYVAAAFVQIVGPTVVCFPDPSSWRAFLDDADLARRTGVFPSALIDPRVLLANRDALSNPGRIATPSAIRIHADGRVSVGVRGGVIGEVDHLRTMLTVPRPLTTALGDEATDGTCAADPSGRAWIGRYLEAMDLMKMLGLGNGAVTISGFGWRLVDDGRANAEPPSSDPFLLDIADGFMLADTTSLRRQLLSPATAQVVDIVHTSSTVEIAAERVARVLDMPVSGGRALCVEAVDALDIHFGRRGDVSCQVTGIAR